MPVRAFVALELSQALKHGILGLIDELKCGGVRASWSRASTLHLTLKFLGDVDEDALPDVAEAVGRAAEPVQPFEFSTGSLGAFPSPRRSRVLWVGVTATDALYDLQAALESELAGLGFPRERRRFHPHITLGRIRDPGGDDTGGILASLEAPRGSVAVHEVLLMRSTLAPGGAIHDVVEAIPLKQGDRGGDA